VLALVHLVWGPLGPAPLRQFLDCYHAHPAGAEHDLVVLFNGVDGQQRPKLLAALDGVDHVVIELQQPVLDVAAYQAALNRLDHEHVCFVNSYSRPLATGWLGTLVTPLSAPHVGIAGSGGSYESALSAAPFWLRRRRRKDFPPFPNPHLRTNGFAIARELMLALHWPAPRSKADTWALESGKRSISRQLWDRGLEVLVVGRDGLAYDAPRWRESATFRSGEQRNLLIADNRTQQYDEAVGARRMELERMAWGEGQVSLPAWVAPARRASRR
jgi:hypothetical protein